MLFDRKNVLITLVSVVFFASLAAQADSISIATSENQPYIGQQLDGYGYVHELIETVFQRANISTDIRFYPWSRALKMTERAESDALMPVHFDEKLQQHFAFSDPFPGGQIGLLKRKDLQLNEGYQAQQTVRQQLQQLKNYQFGVVRDYFYTAEFEQADFLNKQAVSDNIQNLRKLNTQRIDFAVIDKYTAADLMTNHLPHLIGRFEFMKPPLDAKPFHVAFSKQSQGWQQRLAAFNSGLKQAISDGTLEMILAKHGLLELKQKQYGKTIIRVAAVKSEPMIRMQALSAVFEQQHPNIKIEWHLMDENILRLRTKSDFAVADGKFDVIMLGAYEVKQWGKAGWLAKIQDLPSEYDFDDIFPSVRASLMSDGDLYALPFYSESTMTFYNQALFAEAGISMPANLSYEQVKKFAARIHQPQKGIYGICLRGLPGWGVNMPLVNTMLYTHGGRWFDENWQPQLDSDEWRQTLQLYYQLISQYGPPQSHKNSYPDLLKLFQNGQCGMWMDATVFAGDVSDPNTSSVASHVGFAPMPVAVTAKGSKWLWTWSLSIPASSTVKDIAQTYIEWVTSKEYIELVGEQKGWVVVPPGTRLSTYQNPNYQQVAGAFSKQIVNALLNVDPSDVSLKPVPYQGVAYISIPEYTAIGTEVGNIVADFIQDKYTLEQAQQRMQTTVTEQMREFGYIK